MAATEIKVQMQQRRDTAAGWTSAGVVLLAGELGYETDTGHAKLGDGTTAWASLAYLPSAGKVKDGTVSAPGLAFASDPNTGIFRPGADQLNVSTSGEERLSIGNSEFVVNDPSNNVDFRVESDGQTHMLFVDGGNNRVGIGASSPGKLLSLQDSSTPSLALYTGSTIRAELKATSALTSLLSYSNSPITFNIGGSAETEALRIDGDGKVGVGKSSINRTFEIYHATEPYLVLQNSTTGTTASDGFSIVEFGADAYINNREAGNMFFYNNGSERLSIDNLGNVQARRARSNTAGDVALSIQPSDSTIHYGFRIDQTNNNLNLDKVGTGTFLTIDNSGKLMAGTTVPGNGAADDLTLATTGNTGITIRSGASSQGALYFSDGTSGTAEYDGFITYQQGSTSTTDYMSFGTAANERARISSDGYFKAANDGNYLSAVSYHEFNQTNNEQGMIGQCHHASFSENMFIGRCVRAATSAYNFVNLQSNTSGDTEFILRGDGNAYADGSWNGGGADYAEYFEWSDGNTAAEDRRGISVVLDGDKIREAVTGEEPIGVISGNPSVVGDVDVDRWKGQYLRDDYGTYIQEDYEVEDDGGNTVVQQRRQLNPDYNPDTKYVSREDRSEWDCVGLMGKLRIRKGQITGTRWIKMRDVSDTVEEWLVR